MPNSPRSGRYKALIIIAVTMSSFSYLLLMLRWHGNTNIWESLYIFPSGFGTGIAQSAVFISLQAVIQDPSHLAPAISFMYLSSTLAVTLGLPLGNAVMQTVLRRTLRARLLGLGFELGAIAEVSLSCFFSCGVWCCLGVLSAASMCCSCPFADITLPCNRSSKTQSPTWTLSTA